MVVDSWLKMFLKIFCNYLLYTHDLVAVFLCCFTNGMILAYNLKYTWGSNGCGLVWLEVSVSGITHEYYCLP